MTKTELKLKSKYKIETLKDDIRGLHVYEKYYVWQLSPDGQCAYFAAPGICFSCRFYDRDDTLNAKYCNKFSGDFQYDYRNPDELDSFNFVRNSGTYGYGMIAKTLQEMITQVEDFMESDFEGVREQRRTGTTTKGQPIYEFVIISKTKIPVKEVAKKAFFHHAGTFPDLFEQKHLSGDPDFRGVALKDNKEAMTEYLYYKKRYEDREKADQKYQKKLAKVFKETFDFDIQDVVTMFHFELGDFARKLGMEKGWTAETLTEKLGPKALKVLRKAARYYNI